MITTRYTSKTQTVREVLDLPIHHEWINFELDHIKRQLPPNRLKQFTFKLEDFMPQALEWEYWYDEQRQRGSHEVISLLSRMAEVLPPEWHTYLHYGLTSSNVIDSCNHLRWRKLMIELQVQVSSLLQLTVKEPLSSVSSAQIKGMTHGRAATWTTLSTRHGGALAAISWPEYPKRLLPYPVTGGPTGAGDPSQIGRQCITRSSYWPLWTCLAQVAAACEQLATDYRFYCSDFGSVVGVTGRMALPTSSSSMPNKRNPSDFERVCSTSHDIRAEVAKLIMLPAQWLDRDLVHSAVEREAIPRLWEHIFFVVEEMQILISTTELKVDMPLPQHQDSFQRLMTAQLSGMTFAQAREAAQTIGS